MKLKIINALLFQLTWFGCVMGGARGEWIWGAAGVLALATFSASQGTLTRDLRFIAVLCCVGFCLDSLWATTGVLDFGDQATPVFANTVRLAPVWITLLWVGVGLTLMHSLSVFAIKPWFGAIMAGGASLPSYLAGERLGAVVIPDILAMGFIVSVWAALFFGMFNWSRALSLQAGESL